MDRDIYFITPARNDVPPEPDWDLLRAVDDVLKKAGYDLRSKRESTYVFDKVEAAILEKGITHFTGVNLLEAVLPDGTPRQQFLDLLGSMLREIRPKKELLLIDPYIFPTGADLDYIPHIGKLFGPSLKKITRLEIVTSRKRHSKAVEKAFLSMVAGAGPGVVPQVKYSNAFHDRFWIADGKRGMFVGTSLNGIGRRYSIADYLHKRDVANIYARFKALS